jgi:DNA-binding response OmpR family regulator
MVVRVNLEAAGHEVRLAADGRMALDRASAHRPDLILLDLMMPVLDGWGVLDALRDLGNDVPVVIMSALAGQPGTVRRAFELGVDDCIPKPFELDDLLAPVEDILALDAVGRRLRRGRRRADHGLEG